jgi:hypothetical protein
MQPKNIRYVSLICILAAFLWIMAVPVRADFTLTLENGDCDNDNEVTTTDLSVVISAMYGMPNTQNWDPSADLDGDSEINTVDLSIMCLNLSDIGDEAFENEENAAAPTGSYAMRGKVNLGDWIGPCRQPVDVYVQHATQTQYFYKQTVTSGEWFTIKVEVPGTYTVKAKSWHWLRDTAENVTVLDLYPGTASCDYERYGCNDTITVEYTGASSNAATVELWYKKGYTGTWTYYDEDTPSGGAGSINFTPPSGAGTYYFDLVAEDSSSNRSPEPSAGEGDEHIFYDCNLSSCSFSYILSLPIP